jgi:hypothetical protein
VFFIVDDAQFVYERRTTQDLAARVRPEDVGSAKFLALGRPHLSFEFYVACFHDDYDEGRPAAERKRIIRIDVEHVHPEQPLRAVEALKGEQRAYCLVDEQADLDRLRATVGDRMVVLGEQQGTWLVSNGPGRETP